MQAVCVGNARETATRSRWTALPAQIDRAVAVVLHFGSKSPAERPGGRGDQNRGLLSKAARESHQTSAEHLGGCREHGRSLWGPLWYAARAPILVRGAALHEEGLEEVVEEERGSDGKCSKSVPEVHTNNTTCIRVDLASSGGRPEVAPPPSPNPQNKGCSEVPRSTTTAPASSLDAHPVRLGHRRPRGKHATSRRCFEASPRRVAES